ncbi:MAG: hypothetical protein L0Z53_05050 [Acidobacteriales bacterium]|nr:hypothetical protein [Terriglobales bacterium]
MRQPSFQRAQLDPHEPEEHRDPECRLVSGMDRGALKEKMLDKTLADSYPASDPPSSLPDPSAEDSLLLDDEAA